MEDDGEFEGNGRYGVWLYLTNDWEIGPEEPFAHEITVKDFMEQVKRIRPARNSHVD